MTEKAGTSPSAEGINPEASELQRLRDELHVAEQRSTALVRELDQLSYAVSHDLRAPLRAIEGFSSILLEDYPDKLDDQGKHYLNIVRDNTLKLNGYLEALLGLARIGRREMSSSELDMNAMFSAVRIESTAAHPERHIGFEIDNLPPAWGDRDLVRDVVVELVGNAIKFTRTREKAFIRISGETSGKESRYAVSDNGIGFDMQFADKLFGLFQKLNDSKSFEGVGAGLARVRRIVDRHGGRVWAEGRVDAGATFFFSLPAADRTSRDTGSA